MPFKIKNSEWGMMCDRCFKEYGYDSDIGNVLCDAYAAGFIRMYISWGGQIFLCESCSKKTTVAELRNLSC